MTVMFRSLLAVEIQSRVEGGSLAHGTSTPSPSFLTGTKTRRRARLVIAPRPAQEGTSLVPKHTKVPVELCRRRHRMEAMRCLFLAVRVHATGSLKRRYRGKSGHPAGGLNTTRMTHSVTSPPSIAAGRKVY